MVALDPYFTIGSQLAEVIRRIGGVPGGKDAVRQRVRELLTSIRLRDPDDVARRHPHELSGGMLQRVAIALALAGSPKVLIADEPTTALDVTVQAGILDLLRSLRDERGMAIILITHDLGAVADICDRAIVMEQGRIVEEGPVQDIFYRPRHPYLGCAYLFITHGLAVVKEFAARPLVLQHGRIVEEGPSADVCDRPSHEYTQRLVAAAPVPDPVLQRTRRQQRLAVEAASPGLSGRP
jgi:ABC-type dipeptide/oligopeptide/nickel transport system ATPase component